MVSTSTLTGSKVTKTYILFISPFTSYTPSIFPRIARILASLATQVHAGTYNLTIRAVSGLISVGACVVAHEITNRLNSRILETILLLCDMISSLLGFFTRWGILFFPYMTRQQRKHELPMEQPRKHRLQLRSRYIFSFVLGIASKLRTFEDQGFIALSF